MLDLLEFSYIHHGLLRGRIQQRSATATPVADGWDGVAFRKPNHQVRSAECATTISSKKKDTKFLPLRRLVGLWGPSLPSWGDHPPLSTGSLREQRHARSSATTETKSHGQRPSSPFASTGVPFAAPGRAPSPSASSSRSSSPGSLPRTRFAGA
jgi:hypothetical protein